MKYNYIAAWIITSGISLPSNSHSTVLTNQGNTKFTLTNIPDILLERVDEASAIGRLILKGLIGQHDSNNFQSALISEIDEIKKERKNKTGEQAVLILQTHGEIECSIKNPIQTDNFIITFDAIEKSKIKQLHQTEIEAMKVAISCANNNLSRFTHLTDGIYLSDEKNKPIYSLSFSMNAEMSVSTYLSEETTKQINDRYIILNQSNDINSVKRLFSQLVEHRADPLKAFLSGWAAMEILIAKLFKNHEALFFSPLVNTEQQTLREQFIKRIREVMKDKYRLTDKFIAVTVALFPNIEETEVAENYNCFCKLKTIRDSISHGEAFSEKNLPVNELAEILRKYIAAYIATHKSPKNAV